MPASLIISAQRFTSAVCTRPARRAASARCHAECGERLDDFGPGERAGRGVMQFVPDIGRRAAGATIACHPITSNPG
jgi:hypothetical protein